MVQQIFYELGCGHRARGPETLVSGQLRCPYHHEQQLITGVVTMEWYVKCHTCRFARWAGLDKTTADLFANSHWRKNNAHKVDVFHRDNPAAVATAEKWQAYHGWAIGL